MTEPTHGGKRDGAGRKPSRNGRRHAKSIRVSEEVSRFLSVTGTGIIEDMIRRSRKFKEWKTSVASDDDSDTITNER